MRIILTRWPDQAGRLEEGLQAAGVDVGFLPLTRQRLPTDLTPLRDAVGRLTAGQFDWLLLTSGTTVWALQQAGWDGTVPSVTRIGVTGAGTARSLPPAVRDRVWMPQREASAAGILTELPEPASGERILLPQSAQARSQLVEGLRAAGWEVTHTTAYETVRRVHAGALPPSGLTGEEAVDVVDTGDLSTSDTVLITSSTAARAWSQLRLADGVRPRLLAIGRPTAQALRELELPARTLDDVTAGAVMRALRRP
ncbi:uroporphyrinogen-III synthase [Nesterenkonia suensis]